LGRRKRNRKRVERDCGGGSFHFINLEEEVSSKLTTTAEESLDIGNISIASTFI
jgi:hypothetical protein